MPMTSAIHKLSTEDLTDVYGMPDIRNKRWTKLGTVQLAQLKQESRNKYVPPSTPFRSSFTKVSLDNRTNTKSLVKLYAFFRRFKKLLIGKSRC